MAGVGRVLRLVAAGAAALICAASASAHTDSGPGLSLVWPASGTITRGFGYDGAEWHPGIDIGTLRSLDVNAAAPVSSRRSATRRHSTATAMSCSSTWAMGSRRSTRICWRSACTSASRCRRAEARPRRLHGLLHRHALALRGAVARGGVRSLAAPSGYNPVAGGRLAQLGEHQLDKLGVTGSSPVPPTRKGPLVGSFCWARRTNAVIAVPGQCLASRHGSGRRAGIAADRHRGRNRARDPALITRRSQVQILPPLLERPWKQGLSVL